MTLEKQLRHCDHCQTSWVSADPRCWVCKVAGDFGQLVTRLISTHDYSFDGRHADFTRDDAAALLDLAPPQVTRGDN